MKKLLLLTLFLLFHGCNSTQPKAPINNLKLISSQTCKNVSTTISAMALVKWLERNLEEANSMSKEETLMTMIEVGKKDLLNNGYTDEEIQSIAKEILETDIINHLEKDTLSYKYFYESQCNLQEQQKQPLTLKESIFDLQGCWAIEKQTGYLAESCFQEVLTGQRINMQNSNAAKLVKGKEEILNKRPQIAIDSYFNPLINACQNKEEVHPYICADATFHKGHGYIDLIQLQEAREWINKAIELSPKTSVYLSELAFVYQLLKDDKQSFIIYQKAEDLARKYPNYYDNTNKGLGRAIRGQGFILIEQKKFKEAKKVYAKALKLNPKDEKALYELKYIESIENRSTLPTSPLELWKK